MLYGIASYASILYDHESANVESPVPACAISEAILYPSRPCCSVFTVKPNSFASVRSISVSSAR